MNANESESAEKLLLALKKMTRRDFFERRYDNKKLIKFLRGFEKSMIVILSISFLFSVFALLQLFTEVPKNSLFEWSLVLILVFSTLLFLYKYIEMRCIHQIDVVDGFLAPSASNFKSAFNHFSLVIDEVKGMKTQDIEIGLMQYRCRWHPESDLSDVLLRSSIFLSILSSFIATLWRDFLDSSVSEKIAPLQDMVDNIYMEQSTVEFFREKWIESFDTVQGMIIGLLALSVIVYLFYKRLDVAQIFNKKQRHAYVVILLEYVIRLRREEERRMEQASSLPPTQERPICLLTQLRNFICK